MMTDPGIQDHSHQMQYFKMKLRFTNPDDNSDLNSPNIARYWPGSHTNAAFVCMLSKIIVFLSEGIDNIVADTVDAWNFKTIGNEVQELLQEVEVFKDDGEA